MILYDKAALAEKLGRKIADCIDVLLTPESGEREVRGALEKLMRLDNGKLAYKYGNEPSEILLASAVGFLRLNCDENKCVHCGLCTRSCKMQVDPSKHPNSAECIRCGECVRACPVQALTFRKPGTKGENP